MNGAEAPVGILGLPQERAKAMSLAQTVPEQVLPPFGDLRFGRKIRKAACCFTAHPAVGAITGNFGKLTRIF